MEKDNEQKYIKEDVLYEEDEFGNKCKVIIRTVETSTKYIQNLRKSQKAYQERNKEKIFKQIAEWQKDKYTSDPEYREKVKQRNKEYYQRKKQMKKEE